ncbi:hypothetical protein BJY01DRAFT_63060 [Aspergillus pseudoustus]|uniref:N-acetyltransferase domain-containing protein n=1 Tax=Aspergillus pseudoustus TaxID=1810923 RepID=A0ABR4J7F0_9EURO
MSVEIQPTVPNDGAQLADIFLESFADEFNQRLFPPTADVRSFWTKQFNKTIEEIKAGRPTSTKISLVKIKQLNSESKPVIAAFAKWKLYNMTNFREEPEEAGDKAIWPASSDAPLCDRFFGTLDKERQIATDGQTHYYLDMLGTRPEFNGRGLGSKLLNWGLAKADEENVMVFLVSTPQGKRLYERYGFQTVREYEAVPGYIMTSMLRPAPA